MAGRSYQDLEVWQEAINLVEQIHEATGEWPAHERFGLTNQIRRSAISVPAIIAEGLGRGGANELLRFLMIANGSLYEIETHLVIAGRLRSMEPQTAKRLDDQVATVGRLLHGLIRHAKSSQKNVAT